VTRKKKQFTRVAYVKEHGSVHDFDHFSPLIIKGSFDYGKSMAFKSNEKTTDNINCNMAYCCIVYCDGQNGLFFPTI